MTARTSRAIRPTAPSRSLEAEVLVALRRTAAVLEHAVNDLLKPWGITAAQYNVLRILRGAGEGGLCGREVGDRMIARVPDVPRMLERMTDAGLVHRERDRDDRRHSVARITPRGRALLEDVEPALQALHRRAVQGVSRQRLRELARALGTVHAQL